MKRSKKKGKEKYYTFKEYKNKFFPAESDQSTLMIEDPYKFGVRLARESLVKAKELLNNKLS